MRLTAAALLLGVVAGIATGGRPRHLQRARLRCWPVLVVAVGMQLVAGRVGRQNGATALILIAYVLLLVFAAANFAMVGMVVVAIGVAANGLVVAANGAMPVRPSALVAARLVPADEIDRVTFEDDPRRRLEQPGDRLTVLADIIPIAPTRQVVSFGDLVIAVGTIDVVANLFRPVDRRRHARRRGRLTATMSS